MTWTPITYADVSLSADAQLQLPWRADFNAMAYVLSGSGAVGSEARPRREGRLARFGPGAALPVQAAGQQDSRSPTLDLLLLGGSPLRQPVVCSGPFVMHTKEEMVQAITDSQAGRMGAIPATVLNR